MSAYCKYAAISVITNNRGQEFVHFCTGVSELFGGTVTGILACGHVFNHFGSTNSVGITLADVEHAEKKAKRSRKLTVDEFTFHESYLILSYILSRVRSWHHGNILGIANKCSEKPPGVRYIHVKMTNLIVFN